MTVATRLRCVPVIIALLVATLGTSFAPPNVAHAQAPSWRWQTEGAAGFTPGQAYYTDIVLNDLSTPYVSYADAAQSQRVSVRRYFGTGWELVGAAGFSSHPADSTRIALDSTGKPWVAYLDSDLDDRISVMRFDGANWQLVGTEGFSGMAGSLNFVLDHNDVPYVAYVDDDALSKLSVMKFNSSSLAWEYVGLPGFTPGEVQYPSLAVNSQNVPYVAFRDNNTAGRLSVMKLDGTLWQFVGTPGFSSAIAIYSSIAFDHLDQAYVAYSDALVGNRCTVMTYTEGTWTGVGPAGFSRGSVSDVRLALDADDKPYVGYKDGGSGGRASVLAYDPLTDWLPVGSAGFTTGAVQMPRMILDGDGAPWVVYGDLASGGKATVMRFHAPEWALPVIALTTPEGVSRAPTGWYNQASSGTAGLAVHVVALYADDSPASILNLSCVDGQSDVVLTVTGAEGIKTLQGDFTLNEGIHSLNCMATNDGGDIGADPGSTEMPMDYSIDQTLPLLEPAVTPDPPLQYYPATGQPGASDAESGIASAECDPIDTSTVGAGAVNCTATDVAGNTQTASLPYEVKPIEVSVIDLAPGPITVPVGATAAFTVTVLDNLGHTLPIEPVWTTDVGTMQSYTLTAAIHPAGGYVTATVGTFSNRVAVNVVPGPAVRLTIAPRPLNLVLGEQRQLTVSGYDAYDNVTTIPATTWSVQPAGAATITNAGLLTAGQTAGLFTNAVRVSAGGLNDQVDLQVRYPYTVSLPVVMRR